MRWTGNVPPQKWTLFYTKVLAKYKAGDRLKLSVSFEVEPEGQLPPDLVDVAKAALRDLDLDDDVQTSK